ncbi:SAM-dependent methyltransferase [Actimicrobium sp. GrIS 1.19]|uniref:class I SAM-dependent methyltransferase n=1 Tax=Actimicrobium sp. GrIS 1.19 TaxID=3071708 RepID=UPI002E00520C|nr:SAM-dependent methyltransferase [Actimicrobium sp. GrIS 1.19]
MSLFPAHLPSLLRTPALKALALQLSAFIVVSIIHVWLARSGVSVPALAAALAQGVVAALLSRWRRLAWWWLLIQLLFAPAAILLQAAALPPWIFLLAFLLMTSLYWSTWRTQVPLYLSGARVWRAVAALLPPGRALQGVDIGSGIGGLVLELARTRADCQFTGIELAPLPWLISRLRGSLSGSTARFLCGDYQKLDLEAFDVVFAYLSPAAMPALWTKACAEMRPGALLISYAFPIPGHPADRTHPLAGDDRQLHVWQMVSRANSTS